MTPKITIITAAWRVAGVKKVIECLNNQTWQGFEHLIINDNNLEVREWLKENDYFLDSPERHIIDSYVRTHYYGGVARSIGALAAFSYLREIERDLENEWITFADDDNLWEPNHLESFIEVLNDNPTATLIGSDMIRVGVNDPNWKEVVPCEIKHGHCDLGEFLYKADLFRKYGFFWPRPRCKHRFDIELISKMVEGEGKDKIVFTRKSTFLMSYRKR